MQLISNTALMFFFLFNTAFSIANASVGYRGPGGKGNLQIYGEIKQGDYEKVVSHIQGQLQRRPTSVLQISVDSPGGNVIEAMKIGRFLHDNLVIVNMNPAYFDENNEKILNPGLISRCYSACVLLMLGGVQREFEENSIGVHRAFIQRSFNKDISLDESQKLQKELSKLIESYIYEMGGSKALFEKMMSIDSSDLQMLSQPEFDSLIGTNEPSTHEWLYSKCGHELMSSEDSAYLDFFQRWRDAYYGGGYEIRDELIRAALMKLNPDDLESALWAGTKTRQCEYCELINARNRRLGISELRREPCYD